MKGKLYSFMKYIVLSPTPRKFQAVSCFVIVES